MERGEKGRCLIHNLWCPKADATHETTKIRARCEYCMELVWRASQNTTNARPELIKKIGVSYEYTRCYGSSSSVQVKTRTRGRKRGERSTASCNIYGIPYEMLRSCNTFYTCNPFCNCTHVPGTNYLELESMISFAVVKGVRLR